MQMSYISMLENLAVLMRVTSNEFESVSAMHRGTSNAVLPISLCNLRD